MTGLRRWRRFAIPAATGIAAAWLAALGGASGGSDADTWAVVARGRTAQAGQLAIVGAIVRRPVRVGVRAAVPRPRAIALDVVMSCRRRLTTRVGRARPAGRAPYVRTLPLPLTGADNCAVSATGTNPAGTLRLELVRSG